MAATRRAAHRPSRRVAVIEAALALAAERSYDEVTVSDIADRAGMTSAAIYYHFPSKDAVLLEALRTFGADLETECGRRLADAATVDALANFPAELLGWLDTNRCAASVFFVASPGLNRAIDDGRWEFRDEMVLQVAGAVRLARRRISAPKAGVIAVAYLALVENAARAWLDDDDILRKLGPRRLRSETTSVARRILTS